jgi:hypothetical protein
MIAAYVWLIAAAAGTPLQQCKTLDQAFDTAGMRVPCRTAGSDVKLPVEQRATAWRLLATALVADGEENEAQAAFVEFLRLTPRAVMTSKSPKVVTVLDNARRQLSVDGVIALQIDIEDTTVTVTATDPLRRIATLTVNDVGFAEVGGTGKTRVFRGALKDADTLVALGLAPDNTPLDNARAERVLVVPEEDSGFPWGIAAAVAGGVVVAGAGAAWLLTVGPLGREALITVCVESSKCP